MRTLLLMSLALLLSAGVQAAEISKFKISTRDSKRLMIINKWLNENVSSEDCPGRDYFGIVTGSIEPMLVGFEVIAECPDAPTPRVPLYFDSDENYIEN